MIHPDVFLGRLGFYRRKPIVRIDWGGGLSITTSEARAKAVALSAAIWGSHGLASSIHFACLTQAFRSYSIEELEKEGPRKATARKLQAVYETILLPASPTTELPFLAGKELDDCFRADFPLHQLLHLTTQRGGDPPSIEPAYRQAVTLRLSGPMHLLLSSKRPLPFLPELWEQLQSLPHLKQLVQTACWCGQRPFLKALFFTPPRDEPVGSDYELFDAAIENKLGTFLAGFLEVRYAWVFQGERRQKAIDLFHETENRLGLSRLFRPFVIERLPESERFGAGIQAGWIGYWDGLAAIFDPKCEYEEWEGLELMEALALAVNAGKREIVEKAIGHPDLGASLRGYEKKLREGIVPKVERITWRSPRFEGGAGAGR